MSQSIQLETYMTLEKEFGQAIAEKVTHLLDFSFTQAEKKVEQIAVQKKLELKDELSKELASKGDIALVKSEISLLKSELQAEIALSKSELHSKISLLKSETRIYFIILLFTIIILNKDAITLIGQLLGLVK